MYLWRIVYRTENANMYYNNNMRLQLMHRTNNTSVCAMKIAVQIDIKIYGFGCLQVVFHTFTARHTCTHTRCHAHPCICVRFWLWMQCKELQRCVRDIFRRKSSTQQASTRSPNPLIQVDGITSSGVPPQQIIFVRRWRWKHFRTSRIKPVFLVRPLF